MSIFQSIAMSGVVLASVCYVLTVATGLANYCPGDELTLTPSHSSDSAWHGWSCRLHSMTFFGNLDDLASINFDSIEKANKTTLRIHVKDTYETNLQPGIFSPLQSLKHLDLHLNSTMLPTGLFASLTSLESLHLVTYNEQLPDDLVESLPNLKNLKLHIRHKGARIRAEHKRLPHFDAPTTIVNRDLDQILPHNIFDKLPKLEKLSLYCHCTYLPNTLLSKNFNLKRLHLHTEFGALDKTFFVNNEQIEHLNIKSPQYLSINRELLKPLQKLQTLSLAGEDVSIAKGAFDYNENLVSIYVSGNVEKLQRHIFSPLPNLLSLDLGSTGLTSVDEDLIANNRELMYLRLGDNKLRTIPENFFQNNQKLHMVSLDDNHIETLHYDTFKPLSSLVDLHLQRNPNFEMHCDYHLTNRNIHPNLESLLLYGTGHSCRPPWLKVLMEERPEVEVEYQFVTEYEKMQYETITDDEFDDNLEHREESMRLKDLIENGVPECPTVLMQVEGMDMNDAFFTNEAIKIRFHGAKHFVQHQAYWISTALDACRKFTDHRKFSKELVGHAPVAVSKNGHATFKFKKAGEYYLIYKYGTNTPFLPYPEYRLTVQNFVV